MIYSSGLFAYSHVVEANCVFITPCDMAKTKGSKMETTDVAAAGGVGVMMIVYLAIMIFMLVSMWKVFTKAGQPGWACIVPIYNTYIMLKIAGKPGWWLLLMFVPVVSFVIAILMMIGIAQNFGKGSGYAVGLILLSPVFIPMLAFGSAEYAPVEAPVEA